MFDRLRIILVNTTHPGNIGAVARAIKNMGFKQLYLVSPRQFPSEEATARASGAEDILTNAVITQDLEEALKDCDLVIGLSARERKISWPTYSARAAAEHIVAESAQHSESQVALVFGQEQSGLLNEELAKCHFQVTISANSDYASLNLAQAVQVLTYECRMAILTQRDLESRSVVTENAEALASAQEMECYYERLEKTLIQFKFLDPQKPRHLMARLRRLYAKARVDRSELNILQGILTAIEKKTENTDQKEQSVERQYD
jgi:tRNA (cytidine32/uridine32-2'-O)-methyltransferase